MMRLRLHRGVGIAIALAAAVGAIGAAAVIASAGSERRPPNKLHLVATAQKGVGFAPNREPRQGDRFGGGSRLTGDDTGASRTVCTVIGRRALCAIHVKLSEGKLSGQGYVPQQADHTPIAITGLSSTVRGQI